MTRTPASFVWFLGAYSNAHLPPPSCAASTARPNILSLQPYRCARDDYSSGTLLDANENSLGPCSEVAFPELTLERYPCPYQRILKRLLSDYRGCEPNQVFVGVGSDEAIDMLFRIFCVPVSDALARASFVLCSCC